MYVSLSDLLNLTFDLKHTIYYVENLVTTKSVPCFSAGFTLLWDRQTDRDAHVTNVIADTQPTHREVKTHLVDKAPKKKHWRQRQADRQTDRQEKETPTHTDVKQAIDDTTTKCTTKSRVVPTSQDTPSRSQTCSVCRPCDYILHPSQWWPDTLDTPDINTSNGRTVAHRSRQIANC